MYDVLCLPSLNAEIPVESKSTIPPELIGRKLNVSRLTIDHGGSTFVCELDGYLPMEFGQEKFWVIPAGSSFNIAAGLKKLGMQVAIAGAVDPDVYGNTLLEKLAQNEIGNYCFPRKTGTAATLTAIDDSQGLTTLFCYKSNYDLSGFEQSLQVLQRLEKRYVVATGVRSDELAFISRLFQNCKADSVKVLMPNAEVCSGQREALALLLQRTDIFQVNLEEAMAFLRKDNLSEEDAAYMIHDLGPKVVIVTSGHRGAASAAFSHSELVVQQAVEANVVDSTGAGDSFLLGYIWADNQGFNHLKALHIAAWIAARNIEEIGGHCGIPSLERVIAFSETI